MSNVASAFLPMPVWPKIVYTFNARLQLPAAKRKLRQHQDAPAQQERVLTTLIAQLAAASFWKQAGMEGGMSYARFQERVPLHTYEQVAPAVEEMKRGESDVLWPGRCTLFGLTSGTNGSPRCLPMTDALLSHIRRAAFEALLFYTVRAQHTGIFRGRHLVYSATALTPLANSGPSAAFVGEVSGIAARTIPNWARRHLYEPGSAVAQLAPSDAQLEAIADRTRSCDVTLIAGLPNGVARLSHALNQKFSKDNPCDAHLAQRWPNLQCFAHSGALITPYAAELRRVLGPTIAFHDVYAASECFIAAQDAESGQGLRVMTDMGVFFEFVPLSDFDDLRLDQLGLKAVPLAGVKTGTDYVILVTTPGGLARYLLEDVVRFTSVAPPRLIYVGGTRRRLNAMDENVSEKDVSDAIVSLCQRQDWTLVNFHVAPLFASNNLTGQQRGSHEWWIELKPGTVSTPTGPQMAADLDADLKRSNPTYRAKRVAGVLDTPTVRLVMPGVFEHWLRFHQKWGAQHKMPRCQSDRLVAYELAQVTNFAPD